MKNHIIFCQQYMTVVVENRRLLDYELRQQDGLNFTQYCLLGIIVTSSKPVEFSDLIPYFNIQPNSVSKALAILEERGLLLKSSSRSDKRLMELTATKKGKALYRQAQHYLVAYMKRTFWRNIENKEIKALLTNKPVLHIENAQYDSMPDVQENRTALHDSAPNSTVIPISFLLNINYLVQQWISMSLQQELSLIEYRIMAAIDENKIGLKPSELSVLLHVKKNGVSIACCNLEKRGLLKEVADPEDRRCKAIVNSRAGTTIVRKLTAQMAAATQGFYGPVSDSVIKVFNAWHFRMYCELGEFS